MRTCVAYALFSAVLALCCNARLASPELTLKRYAPVSRLHAARTPVTRLKFRTIDFHQHLRLQGEKNALAPADILATMDRFNVETMVHLTGGYGAELERTLNQLARPHPGRFIVFTELNWDHLKQPDFGVRMAADIKAAVAAGARGLKLLKWFGLGARHPDGTLVRVDDTRFDPVWKMCGDLRIPVAIHTGDPEAFFDPVDEHNERYDELQAHPDWSFHAAKWPRLPALLAARDSMIARHPQTTFVALHVGGWPENLDYVSQLLLTHPNVFVDIGAREAELGRQPQRARRFFIDFSDRILFGTDEAPGAWNKNGADVYESYGRTLETTDEYYDYYAAPRQGRWKIYGLGLPGDVLQKVYYANARALFDRLAAP